MSDSANSNEPHPTSRRLLLTLARVPAMLAIALVRVYQYTISPLIGPNCRFEPTCSSYFIGAVKKYGLVRGGLRGVGRILRCHPWNPGGYDPP
ncbi:MAG: membrane protein insertion efficiency factor YidD [Planctomycetales bacterium]|nr:membrane protein insertion efficiency factor YidD [Planctomycetales bacterium]